MLRQFTAVAVVLGGLSTTPASAAPQFAAHIFLAPSSYLGVGIIEVGSETAKTIGLVERHGVEISSVADESPADRAGLREGDVVLTYRQERVHGMEHFARLVRETPVGGQVTLGVVRDGERLTLSVQIGSRESMSKIHEKSAASGDSNLGERRRFDDLLSQIRPFRNLLRDGGRRDCDNCRGFLRNFDIAIEIPSVYMGLRIDRLGVEVESVDGQFGEFFGVEAGVLIRTVRDKSPAQRAGLRSGDVIIAAGSDPVRRPSDVSRAVASPDDDGQIPLTVVRDRESVRVVLEIRSGKETTPARPVSLRD